MKNFLPVLFALLIAITFTSCASFERNMVVSDKQKTVYYPNMKQVGDFYVINFMNQRTSKIGVQILDRYQEPYYLNEESVKAYIQRDKGKSEMVYLRGEGYVPDIWEGENIGSGATIYSKRLPWVKNEHNAKVTVLVPLPNTGEVKLVFNCVSRHLESK